MKTVYKIESEEDIHDNYIQLPAMVGYMGLSPYARTLYEQYRITVGYKEDNVCYKGVRKLAAECCMSQASVIKARKELEAHGLIEVATCQEVHQQTHVTRIKNIWKTNHGFFKQTAKNMEQNNI